jgi:hypothetical protein
LVSCHSPVLISEGLVNHSEATKPIRQIKKRD